MIVPEHFNFARDVIDKLALQNRRGLLFVAADGTRHNYSFAEISEQSQRYAAVLRERGIERGSRVIVALPKIPQWLFVMLALDRLGAIAIPGPEQLRAKDLLYRADHAEAVAMIGDAPNLAELQAARKDAKTVRAGFSVRGGAEGWLDLDALAAQAAPFAGVDTRADEWAYIVYTSGTTKDPKGVVHDRAYAYAKRSQAQFWLDCTPEGFGVVQRLDRLGEIVVERVARPVVARQHDRLARGRIRSTTAHGSPSRARGNDSLPSADRISARSKASRSRQHWKLPKLRHCVSAGEPLNPEVIARWKEAFGLEILDGYGQTENTLLVANLHGDTVRPGSMGKPTPGHEVTVIDEDGNECKTGETGDIALRGTPPSLFKGYLKNPEETAKSYRAGYYLTGDRAYIDEDGYFWFVGRSDDVI